MALISIAYTISSLSTMIKNTDSKTMERGLDKADSRLTQVMYSITLVLL